MKTVRGVFLLTVGIVLIGISRLMVCDAVQYWSTTLHGMAQWSGAMTGFSVIAGAVGVVVGLVMLVLPKEWSP